MDHNLKRQIIVAAAVAKGAGFDRTHDALVEVLKEIGISEPDMSLHIISDAQNTRLN